MVKQVTSETVIIDESIEKQRPFPNEKLAPLIQPMRHIDKVFFEKICEKSNVNEK